MTHPFVRPLIGTLAASTIGAAAVLPAQAADPLTWTKQAPTTAPASRSYFAMAYDSTSARTVMFGGQLANGTSTNETWEWDGSNWTLKQPATSPSARNGETMVYDSIRHVTVLFGGTIGNDTWEWDGVNWTLRNSTHTPPGRSFAAMAFDSARGKTVLFGGQGYPGGTFAQFGDTWEWDGTDWTQASPATSPVQRDNAAMAFDSARGV